MICMISYDSLLCVIVLSFRLRLNKAHTTAHLQGSSGLHASTGQATTGDQHNVISDRCMVQVSTVEHQNTLSDIQ